MYNVAMIYICLDFGMHTPGENMYQDCSARALYPSGVAKHILV